MGGDQDKTWGALRIEKKNWALVSERHGFACIDGNKLIGGEPPERRPMPIAEWKNRHGVTKLYLSRVWPDGRRFRRVMPNRKTAHQLDAKITTAVALGDWRALRDELDGVRPSDPTLTEFSEIYLEEYCGPRNKRLDFKRHQLNFILPVLGSRRVKDITRADAYKLVEVRSRTVKAPTVNRAVAVLKNLLTFAVEKGTIETNPLLGFRRLPEPQKALRTLTLEEERSLVEHVAANDLTIGAFTAVLGETGLRLGEGLRLQWGDLDLGDGRLTVGESKSGKVRHVPLTPYAVEWLRNVERVVGMPWVWMRTRTEPWRDPRGPFHAGRKAAGLEWVGFHDLRRFRATQWVKMGVDIRTVQGLLGHASITTTQIYAHFAPDHAKAEVLRVAREEEKRDGEVSQEASV
jgi:integrase